MAYTRNDIAFKQNQEYDEIGHAEALSRGLVSFAKGFDLDIDTGIITNGIGNADGVFFQLGLEGETATITVPTNGWVIAHAHLDGITNSYADLITGSTVPTSTDTDRYTPLYKITGTTVEDYRMSQWVDDVHFESRGDDKFVLYINGKPSPEFSASLIQSSYTKSQSDLKYVYGYDLSSVYNTTMDSSYAGASLATIIRDIHYGTQPRTAHPTILSYNTSTLYPNLNAAIVKVVKDFYNVTLSGVPGFWMEIPTDTLSTPGKITMFSNNSTERYELAVDNFDTISESGTLSNTSMFKPLGLHVKSIDTISSVSVGGSLEVEGNLYTKNGVYSTNKDRSYQLYAGGGSYMYTGQSIKLALHGYNMSDYEQVTLIFAPYNNGAVVNKGFVSYTLHNAGSLESDIDCFYNEHTIWVKGYGFDDAPVQKRIDINSDGTVTGRTGGSTSADTRSAVLYRVWGRVSEEAYGRVYG